MPDRGQSWSLLLMAAAILLLNVWLNGPLFAPGELPFRGSIEGGYVGTARFLSQHPNPWGWNPLQYCGLPTQFLYVPLVPYVSAIGMRLFPTVSPDTVYRFLVSLMTCLGPVTLFLFAAAFTGSRRWAFAMAVAYSLLSPSYALFPAVEKDRGIVQLPWRIQVLAKYGEGPHTTGLTLLPLALLAVWRTATKAGYRGILGAALLLAGIPLTNWLAAFALAISCLLLLLAAWGEPAFRTARVLAAAALAWLLAAFWLTPSFVRTIVFNWPADSFAYQLHRTQALLLGGLVAGAVLIRLVCFWRRTSFYLAFAILGTFVFGSIATAFYIYGIDIIPESRRYAIEFELFLALALAEILRLAWHSSNGTIRMCAAGSAAVMLLVGAPQLWAEATQGWQRWWPSPPPSTVEYQLAQWIAQHPPQGRVFASGGMRFRLNSWFDVPQVGGGFETGLQNRVPLELAYHVRAAVGEDDALAKLQALGAEYIVVHGPKSREYYRDFHRPDRLSARLPAVFHVEDDTIYALPPQPLARYVSDNAPVSVRWTDASALTITARSRSSDAISLKVNADPGWHATQDGNPLAIARDELGFMLLQPTPSAAGRIELRYRGTAEQKIMAAVSALAWIGALAALFRKPYVQDIRI